MLHGPQSGERLARHSSSSPAPPPAGRALSGDSSEGGDPSFDPAEPSGEATGPLADLAGRFRFNATLLEMLVSGFAPDEWFRAAGSSAPAIRVLGHVATMRLSLLRTLGVDVDERSWESLFGEHGNPPVSLDDLPLPRVSELLEVVRASDVLLTEELTALSAAEIDEVWAEEGATAVSLGDSVGFYYFDETFHLGQLGLLRQFLGKRRVI